MVSLGPVNFGGASDQGGFVVWTNPNNVLAFDAAYATWVVAQTPSNDLRVYEPALGALPESIILQGIVVEFSGYLDNPSLNVQAEVQLMRLGGLIGNEKTFSDFGAVGVGNYASLGGASDMWGATLARSDLLLSGSSGFGLHIRFRNFSSPSTTNGRLDHIRMTVYYEEVRRSMQLLGVR